MNMEWHIYPNPTDPNLPLQCEGPAYCCLFGYGFLRVSGDDAATFLQGQTTCDVNALSPGHSGVGALCTPKGRVIANFRLLRSEQGFYLLLAADLTETVRKRLQIYLLRSKVLLEDLTPRHGMIGVMGDGLESVLETYCIKIPSDPGTWLETPDYLALKLNDDSGRTLITAEMDMGRRLWSYLAEKLSLVNPSLWRLKDIEAGYPEIVAATSNEFLPQMLNLDMLGGISFQKGCYTGQEIVTRTYYLGQVKRRMFRLRCDGEAKPVTGAVIYDISEAEPKNVGQVVMAAPETLTSYQLLAVLGVRSAGSKNLQILGSDGLKAEILALPYP
jgi:folate-binding protein YgfZ